MIMFFFSSLLPALCSDRFSRGTAFVSSLLLVMWKQEMYGALGVQDKFGVLTTTMFRIMAHCVHIASCHVVLHHTAPNDIIASHIILQCSMWDDVIAVDAITLYCVSRCII